MMDFWFMVVPTFKSFHHHSPTRKTTSLVEFTRCCHISNMCPKGKWRVFGWLGWTKKYFKLDSRFEWDSEWLAFMAWKIPKSAKETDSNAQGSDSGREEFCTVQVDCELKHCDETISKGIGDLRWGCSHWNGRPGWNFIIMGWWHPNPPCHLLRGNPLSLSPSPPM